MNHTIT